jgi:hypothetical protein
MSATKFYPATPTKWSRGGIYKRTIIKPNDLIIKSKRVRATKPEMVTRRRRLIEIIKEEHPATVRQVYYQADAHKIVPKDDSGYRKVQTKFTELRRDGTVPYEWIVDHGRFVRRPFTVNGIVEALNETRRQHRKSPWQYVPDYVQIWIEKDALVGVVEPVTSEYDVPLLSARGYSSLSFLHKAAQELKELLLGCPIYIYQFGDLDPSGAHASEVIERDLRGFAPEADIRFERIGITPQQVKDLELQSALRDTKTKDPRYEWFLEKYRDEPILNGGLLSVELDAIRPSLLRDLVREVIERHLPRETLDAVNAEGERERAYLSRLMDRHIADEAALHCDYSAYGSDHADALQDGGAR